MKLQILISTTNNLYTNFQDGNFIIINQILDESLEALDRQNVYSYYEKGLSKSRNRALEKATADICLITDDDVEFKSNTEKTVLEAFTNNLDADIITFQIETPEGKLYKNYKNNSFYHTKKTIMSVSSIEIAFKRKSIIDNDIKFDEKFGLGTDLPTGEEIIFLTDALKKGLKILYIPIPIVVHPIESSGKDYDNEKLIMAKGAMFYRIFGVLGYAISLIFTLKKQKLSSKYTFAKFFDLMLKGIKKYRGKLNAKE